ncbi:hypothetical protein [Halobaculum sp. D14]|uniref:hypothetical protein n=1 Tax=unclassified Halobaculum TaxID=2640896 RepID=UPI003EBD7903
MADGPTMSTLTDEDTGKILVDSEGEEIGVVTDVESGAAYVEPEPSIPTAVEAAFGYSEHDDDDLTVPGDAVDTVTDEEVRLAGDV